MAIDAGPAAAPPSGADIHNDTRAGELRSPMGLERRSTPSMAMSTSDLTRELEDLIAALDRRVPRVEQAGETAIARDAAALRAKAVQRLAELAGHPAVPAAQGGGDRAW
jgi:hypothetical protein